MMRINLLREASPAVTRVASSSTAARQVLMFMVSLAVAMSIVGFLYFYWNNQENHEQADLTREQIRQKELAAVRVQNQQYQRQLKQLEERIDTIQKLQSSRQGPVDLMTGLGDMVGSTKDLYLLQVTPQGNVLHIRGQSQTVEAIAQFVKALNSSSRFSGVHLERYYQDDRYGRVNFKFNIDCAYAPPVRGEQVAAKQVAGVPAAPAGRR